MKMGKKGSKPKPTKTANPQPKAKPAQAPQQGGGLVQLARRIGRVEANFAVALRGVEGIQPLEDFENVADWRTDTLGRISQAFHRHPGVKAGEKQRKLERQGDGKNEVVEADGTYDARDAACCQDQLRTPGAAFARFDPGHSAS